MGEKERERGIEKIPFWSKGEQASVKKRRHVGSSRNGTCAMYRVSQSVAGHI
jgi:hypothetical protein